MIIRIIKLITSIFVFLYDYLFKKLCQLIGIKSHATFVVVYYHSVPIDQIDKFAQQMDAFIKCGITVCAEYDGPFCDNFHYIALTFDDGFTSVVQNALPELIKRNIPVSIFVPTGCLGRQPTWISNEDNLGKNEVVISNRQLLELKRNKLVSMGSHCITHSKLTCLNYSRSEHEIVQSKKYLENLLGIKIRTLSFPYGLYNNQHIELSRKAGYDRIFSIEPSLASINSDRFVFGRVKMETTDWKIEYKCKFSGAYRWLPFAFRVKKRILTIFYKK